MLEAANHIVLEQNMLVEGDAITVSLIQNPTIDDVLITEMQIQASSIETGRDLSQERRVDRDIRDYLIRIGVER